MLRTLMTTLALAIMAFALAGSGSIAANTTADKYSCPAMLLARPAEGFASQPAISGKVALTVDTAGKVSGTLARAGEAAVSVAGQVTGSSVKISFQMADGREISASGTAKAPGNICAGTNPRLSVGQTRVAGLTAPPAQTVVEWMTLSMP